MQVIATPPLLLSTAIKEIRCLGPSWPLEEVPAAVPIEEEGHAEVQVQGQGSILLPLPLLLLLLLRLSQLQGS